MYVLRIDDCGRSMKSKEVGNLETFLSWRDTLSLWHYPCYLGFIPALHDEDDAGRIHVLRQEENVCVHGNTHKKDEVLSAEIFKSCRDHLKACDAYIPPFNKYFEDQLLFWQQAGGKYFFGGFHGRHHTYGEQPAEVYKIWHVPACKRLYGRSGDIIKNLSNNDRFEVITLHMTWEIKAGISKTKRLLDKIQERLVTLDEASVHWRNDK